VRHLIHLRLILPAAAAILLLCWALWFGGQVMQQEQCFGPWCISATNGSLTIHGVPSASEDL
jgi:hypothetical protein